LVTLLDIPLFLGALPSKLFDYIACGKPVLCGVGGEAKSILDKSRGGLTFSPNDDQQLSDLILQILRDMKELPINPESGVEFIKNNYSATKMRKLIENIIIDIKNKA
jgi:glycosyltransferase involved in cell wall biosynthesis